jgi:hypothetical protein
LRKRLNSYAGCSPECFENFLLDKYLHVYGCEGKATAFMVRPLSLDVIYYTFADVDDKYFIVNMQGVGYQDTDLYSAFYATLPIIGHDANYYQAGDDELWILPRAQYGHYIFDEVIVSLVSYLTHYQRAPFKLHVVTSRSWQLQVVEDISLILFGQSVQINEIKIRNTSHKIILAGGLVSIASFLPAVNSFASLVKDKGTCPPSINYKSDNVTFLSREGFDAGIKDRIVNRKELMDCLSSCNIDIVRPHELSLSQLREILKTSRLIISEPGTTPLLAYITASQQTQFINLMSIRCLKDCAQPFVYSGWRYHIPWLGRIKTTIWGTPVKIHPNPFSDACVYDVEALVDAIES